MALFLVERNFTETIEDHSDEDQENMVAVNNELGLQWINTFLSEDRTRTYCLYESPSAELLIEHARILGIPADEIVQVTSTTGDFGSV